MKGKLKVLGSGCKQMHQDAELIKNIAAENEWP